MQIIVLSLTTDLLIIQVWKKTANLKFLLIITGGGTNTPAGKDIKNWVIMNAPESISGEKGETINVNVDFNHYMGVGGKIHTLTKNIFRKQQLILMEIF